MKDSRVEVMPSTTITTSDTDTNGTSIDLTGDYVGDHIFGTGDYGLNVEVMASDVTTGTGDGFTITWKWQVAPDNAGSPGTWVDFGRIGVMTVDTDGKFLDKDSNVLTVTRAKKYSTLRVGPTYQWARVVATTLGMTNGEIVILKASLSDGAVGRIDDEDIH